MDHLKVLLFVCFFVIASVVCFDFLTMKWGFSFTTRDRTLTPCSGRQSVNHWRARKSLGVHFKRLGLGWVKHTQSLLSRILMNDLTAHSYT